jgi:flagellar hook-basal body complex protein FliE
MAPIAPIQPANPATIQSIAPAPASANPEAGSIFQNMFTDAVNTVENFQSQAGNAIQDLLSGANEDVHTAVIAAQRANLSFQLFMQVRNKVVSAYQSLMGMQL